MIAGTERYSKLLDMHPGRSNFASTDIECTCMGDILSALPPSLMPPDPGTLCVSVWAEEMHIIDKQAFSVYPANGSSFVACSLVI
jgi:hypothetical protein